MSLHSLRSITVVDDDEYLHFVTRTGFVANSNGSNISCAAMTVDAFPRALRPFPFRLSANGDICATKSGERTPAL